MQPIPKVKKETGKFWEVQFDLIVCLNILGFKYEIADRLEPFRLLLLLRKIEHPESWRAQELLAQLVILKRLGFEPEHADGKYL